MLYLKMLFSANGTVEYGQAIRWLYLLGYLGKEEKAERKLNGLDKKNFKKWRKIHNKGFNDYLDAVRV